MSADESLAGTRTRRFPLRLCEVLEQEFVAIHGAPPAAPGWLLEPRDISFAPFVACLLYPSRHPYSSAIQAVRDKLAASGIGMPASPEEEADETFKQSAIDALNRALDDPQDLYDPRLLGASHPVWHLAQLLDPNAGPAPRGEPASSSRDSTRHDAIASGPEARRAASDEQLQLNRLLLEAVFPPTAIARVDTVRLSKLFHRLHALRGADAMPGALCLSGGGIRSASFSLGVLQGLARCGVLEKFDYLSTVSGGGYLGSWFSTWVQRHPEGLAGVVAELRAHAQPEAGGVNRLVAPDAGPLRFLRSYSHFLNPKAGLLSADTWTWIGIYLRNLTLNWIVLIPLLLFLIAAPRLYAARLYDWPLRDFPLFFWITTLAATLTLVCVNVNRPSVSEPAAPAAGTPLQLRRLDRLRARWSRQGLIVAFSVMPLLLFSLFMALLVWGMPASTTPLSLHQIGSLLTASVASASLSLPYVAFEHMVVWGELIVLVAWAVSTVMLPVQPWPKRLIELLAMLVAGAFTWFVVAAFPQYAGHYDSSPEPVFVTASFEIYPAHLYSVLAVPSIVLAVLAGMTLFIGFVSKYGWIEDEDREWWARFGSWALIATTAWIAFAAIAVFGPVLLLESPKLASAVGGVSGLLAVLLGKSSLSPANGRKGAAPAEQRNTLVARLGPSALAVGSLVFLAVFLAFLSLLTSAALKYLMALPAQAPGSALADFVHYALGVDPTQLKSACGLGAPWNSWGERSVFGDPRVHLALACQTPSSLIAALMLAWAGVVAVASWAINLNKFSLHAAYRIRIVRTFLGASRREDRQPNPFTGFDPLDNVQMHELQPGLLREGDILDLPHFVAQLHSALVGGSTGSDPRSRSHVLLVRRLCMRDIDKSGVLAGRLRVAKPGDAVLKSLQQDIIKKLNRVLETTRLDRSRDFLSLLRDDADGRARRSAVERYCAHGNVIFANRLLIEAAFPDDLRHYDFPPPPPHRLIHVLNLTLNLVHGRRLAWQERKAAPFVVTPMHSGSYYLGYRQSRDYGGPDGISIGTAAAISGAAVSPNMGYSSSPIAALLLTLFNVRLGWWLGNPGIAGETTYTRSEPKFSLRPVLAEALGLTDDRNPYVYLSDGGHFENMGVFEMVLRRCRLIVATDAGADPDYRFGDLGNALRKIRIDLGIEIDFETMPIHKREREGDTSGRYCAIGRIRYDRIDGPGAPDGVLIVIKPVLRGDEPADVLNYGAQNPLFPQEPTADQFFGESQFESYRHLGEFAVEGACTPSAPDDAREPWAVRLVEAVRLHLGAPYTGKGHWLERWLEDARKPG